MESQNVFSGSKNKANNNEEQYKEKHFKSWFLVDKNTFTNAHKHFCLEMAYVNNVSACCITLSNVCVAFIQTVIRRIARERKKLPRSISFFYLLLLSCFYFFDWCCLLLLAGVQFSRVKLVNVVLIRSDLLLLLWLNSTHSLLT